MDFQEFNRAGDPQLGADHAVMLVKTHLRLRVLSELLRQLLDGTGLEIEARFIGEPES